MTLNPDHNWYLQRKWLLKPSVQTGIYFCFLALFLVIGAILYVLNAPKRAPGDTCGGFLFPSVGLQSSLTILGAILLVILLWKAKDTIHLKTEMKVIVVILLPLFVVWSTVQIFPHWFPGNFLSGYLIMMALSVKISFGLIFL